MEDTLRAALPKSFLVKPTGWNQALDLTDLVEEWTLALLDPVDALRCSAKRMLMGGTGLEPVTPSLSSWCSPN